MKKIISIIILCLTLFTLCFSVYAAEETDYYADVYFQEDMSAAITQYANSTSPYNFIVTFTCGNSKYYLIKFQSNSMSYGGTDVYKDGAWKTSVDYKHIKLLSEPTADVMAFLNEYANVVLNVPVEPCDGSICNVADYNVDNVCDTCGKPLAYSVQRSFVPTGFPTNLPVLPLGFGADSKYIVFNKGSEVKLYVFTPRELNPVDKWLTTGTDNYIQIQTVNAVGAPVMTIRYTYVLSDGEWQLLNATDIAVSHLESFNEVTVSYSSLNLYYQDGSLFFPHPLWKEMVKVTTEAISTQLPTLGTTATIITIAGLSLIASLIGLILLLKVLRRFPS